MNDLVNNSPGFTTYKIHADDLIKLRELIHVQYIETLAKHILLAKQNLDIQNYHLLDNLVDHKSLWTKLSRSLPQSSVEVIKRLDFYKDLINNFGTFSISKLCYGNNVDMEREEIYWRLVRPNKISDVGSLHADIWFHELLNSFGSSIPRHSKTYKIWIPIYCESGKSGLSLVPDSHKRIWNHDKYIINNQPVIIFKDKATPVLIDTLPGEAIIFNDKLLHCGHINQGKSTRVSLEITLVFTD